MIKHVKDKWTQKSIFEKLLMVLLFFQVTLIIISNFTLIDQNLDCDSANMLNHIVTMAKERTLIIPDWLYNSTLEWDCTALFALPIFLFTRNIYISCALSNTILLCFFIVVIFYLFYGEESSYPLLCANVICIPYRVGPLDYYNMLFFSGAQYIVKVMIPLLFIGIIVAMENKRSDEKYFGLGKGMPWCFTALYFVLLLISSISSNVYVAACGVAPICVVYVCYKFLRWEKIPGTIYALLGGSVVCALLGMAGNHAILGESKATGMVLCNITSLLENVSSCFFGLFELIGGTTSQELAVFSLQGIMTVAKISLLIFILGWGAVALVKCIRKEGNLRLLLLLSVFLWNYFILNVTDVRYGSYTYEYRYHLIGMLPLMCAAVTVFHQSLVKLRRQQSTILCVIVCLALATLSGFSFRELFQREDPNIQLKEIVQYCADMDIETIYMLHDSGGSEICRLLDGERLYLELLGGGTTRVFDYYGRYSEAPMQTDGAIVVVIDAEWNLGDSFSINENTLVRFDTVGDRSLYYFAGTH